MTAQAPANQSDWSSRIELAQQILPLITRLHNEHNVVTSIFGRLLVNVTDIDIIKHHRYARMVNNDRELPLTATLPILQELVQMNLGPASIDIGRIATGLESARDAGDADVDMRSYLEQELADILDKHSDTEPVDVVLYGFGRIGRLLARILIAHEATYGGVRLRAVVLRKKSDDDIEKRASLLRRDSIHGAFDGTITVDDQNNVIWANGTAIQVIYASDPSTIDYTAYGINNAVLVDNTGVWRDSAGLSKHLESTGISKVLLTAPGKGDVKNIVYGINHTDIEDTDRVLSAASCTTNGITPVLKVINDRYGIIHGHVETVHSFTNDQNLTDNFHKGPRRGRAAGLNMVLTETGAAKAVAKALPELTGKLTGNAIRVPTPNVSMAVLNLNLEKDTTADEVNEYIHQVALHSDLRQQIDYIKSPDVVSSDFVGSTHAGIVDGLATIADGKNLVLYVWYDNEFGYSNQVVRIVEEIAGARPKVYPKRIGSAELA